MEVPAPCINETDSLVLAYRMFKEKRLTHIMVVNDEKKLVGLISQKYLYKTVAPKKVIPGEELEIRPGILIDGDSFFTKELLDSYLLDSVMNKAPFTLTREDSVGVAIIAMNEKVLSCIPVINDDKVLEGMIMDRHIIEYISNILQE